MALRAQEVAGRPGCVVEDTRHFLLECPAFDPIRWKYGLLPIDPWSVPDAGACMRAFFAHERQVAVAAMVAEMTEHRAVLLGEPVRW